MIKQMHSMQKPSHTLSVAMCTCNGEKYIEQQVRSILNQDLRVDEIVVCDDKSTDDTLRILNTIAHEHTDIKWTIKTNDTRLGVTKNFEHAISLCNGDIIFLSDQDDIWEHDKTKVISEFFNNNNDITVVFTDARLINEDNEVISKHTLLDAMSIKPNIKYWNAGLQLEYLFECPRATGATMAVRNSYAKKCFPLSDIPKCLHDEQLSIRACLDGKLGVITTCLISYRIHKGNVVGLSPENWINKQSAPPTIEEILVPRATLSVYAPFLNNRAKFYNKRYKYYPYLIGKLILALYFPLYIVFYKKYWLQFFLSDITTNIRNSIKQKLWIPEF